MGFALKDIAYGWKIGVAAVLTGTTIFVADNIRQRIYQRDFVEIALGVHERALATQYQTNPVAYYVVSPSFVRNWYSNDYVATVTNGVTNWTAVLYTNTYTNVMSARTDRAMAVELDAKIKALIPYFVDINSVFDGTTNIVMLTVTGLWASLGIGDGTNQFTSVPEWVGTNGVTNAATYGALPWRIYKEDLEERYKVLNALKILPAIHYFEGVSMVLTNFGITTSGKAWFGGDSDSPYAFIEYPSGLTTLGKATGTLYNIQIKNFYDLGSFPGYTLLTMGESSGGFFQNPGLSCGIRFSRGASFYPDWFNAELIFEANVNYLYVLNCKYAGGVGMTNASASYTLSNVLVSAEGGGYHATACFELWPVIKYPFQYCTNAYWE